MLLGLSQIIDCPGASVSFSTSLDFRDLRFGSSYPVSYTHLDVYKRQLTSWLTVRVPS